MADAPNKRARAGKDKSAGGKDKRAGGEEKSAGGKKGEKEIAGGGFVGKEGVFWEVSAGSGGSGWKGGGRGMRIRANFLCSGDSCLVNGE